MFVHLCNSIRAGKKKLIASEVNFISVSLFPLITQPRHIYYLLPSKPWQQSRSEIEKREGKTFFFFPSQFNPWTTVPMKYERCGFWPCPAAPAPAVKRKKQQQRQQGRIVDFWNCRAALQQRLLGKLQPNFAQPFFQVACYLPSSTRRRAPPSKRLEEEQRLLLLVLLRRRASAGVKLYLQLLLLL